MDKATAAKAAHEPRLLAIAPVMVDASSEDGSRTGAMCAANTLLTMH
jgi:hypothetical protein